MKTLIQRVSRAEVRVEGETVGRIGKGVVLLVGVERGDDERDAAATARKVAALVGSAPANRPSRRVAMPSRSRNTPCGTGPCETAPRAVAAAASAPKSTWAVRSASPGVAKTSA